MLPALTWAAEPKINHLFKLSDFNGTIPYGDVILHVDRQQNETYAVLGHTVRIFNHSGMETFHFEAETARATILDLFVDESGDIFLLTYDRQTRGLDRNWWISRCNYRGEPIERIDVGGLPADFAEFGPNLMLYRDGEVVLISRSQMLVATVDKSGAFLRGRDLAALLQIDDPGVNEMLGFTIDRAGNMAFTVPVLFKVFVVAPDDTVRQFGTPGSAPGKFGIVSGIVSDEYGNYFVADRLRGVVMVFDSTLAFVTELTRETKRSLLNRPSRLAMGNDGRFLVTQSRNKGVSVFALKSVNDRSTPDHLGIGSLAKGGSAESTETSTQSRNKDTVDPAGATVSSAYVD